MNIETIKCSCGKDIPMPSLLPGMSSIEGWQYCCPECLNERWQADIAYQEAAANEEQNLQPEG